MSSATPTTIDSPAKASRYLLELSSRVPIEEALRAVESRAAPRVASHLQGLRRYVNGESPAKPDARFALYADFAKHLSDKSLASAGAAVINDSLTAARTLADSVRVGLPGDLYYPALLLLLATSIATLWLTAIAPEFAELYASFEGGLPRLTQTLIDAPALLFGAIGVLAVLLILAFVGTRRLAAAVATLGALQPSWLRLFCGSRVARCHDQWRVTTLATAWVHAGREPAAALRESLQTLNVPAAALGGLSDAVTLAQGLGLADHELDHQRRSAATEYRAAWELSRALWFRALQFAVAILVGVLTIAMYLPLFSMGAVI